MFHIWTMPKAKAWPIQTNKKNWEWCSKSFISLTVTIWGKTCYQDAKVITSQPQAPDVWILPPPLFLIFFLAGIISWKYVNSLSIPSIFRFWPVLEIGLLPICYIYRTSDNLYLIYSEEAGQYSNESARTSLNIDTPLHCKSDTKCHVLCKWFVEWSNGMSPHVRSLVHGTESLRLHRIQTCARISRSWIHFII